MMILQRNTRAGVRSPHRPEISGTLWYELGLGHVLASGLVSVAISATFPGIALSGSQPGIALSATQPAITITAEVG